MRIRVVLALITLLLRNAGPAAAVQLYVGAALQYDVAFPHYSLSSLTESGWIHDFGCWGSETTFGLAWPAFSVYAGYHFVSSSIYVELVPPRHSSWREQRFILGARWHMNGNGDYPVKPTVGAAVTYGESTLLWDNQAEEFEHLTLRKSKNVGEMIEFGFLIRLNSMVDLTIMAQGHRFEPDFDADGDDFSPDHYVVLMPGWQIGTRIRFPDL